MQKKLLLGILLCCFVLKLFPQSPPKGQVIAPTGEPLPFVNIIINGDTQQGTSTDIDGRFSLPEGISIQTLSLSYIGYRDLQLQIDTVDTKPPWQIIMQAQAYDFAAIEIVAGVNPADIIMRRVIRNRHRNDPENLDSYRCQTYNKVVMSWLPKLEAYQEKLAAKKAKKDSFTLNEQQTRLLKVMKNASKHHLFMMESLTERLFKHPESHAETILANKVSGFSEVSFTALANDVQPFSFYDEEVMLIDKAYLNPVSPGSPERYFFSLEDTLFRLQDTVYLITFHPRKQKNFNGLKGVLYINTDRYAVQNIIAEPADTGLLHFRIEQQYNRPQGQAWFPAQLNYEIQLPKYPDPLLGLQVSGKSYVQEVEQNIPLDAKPFRRADRYIFADSAHVQDEAAWQIFRAEPLDTMEERTYQLVDSIGREKHFDRWMDRIEALGRGRWSFGALDLALNRIIQLNQFENVRVGFGLYTSEKVSSWFTLGGYAGYGFKDNQWKYGADISFFPDWDRNWEWSWYYRKDLGEANSQLFPLTSDLVSRRFFASRMDSYVRFGTFFRATLMRFLQIGLEASRSQEQPLYGYTFLPDPDANPASEFNFTETAIHLHYAYGQQYRRILGNRVPDGKERPYPSLSLSVKRGLGKKLGGDYPYWQYFLAVDHSFRLSRLGKTTYRLEGALTNGSVPISRLYNSAGLGREFQVLTIGNIFQTMDSYEFLSDRYFTFFFRQNFGTLLFKTKWIRPTINLEHHFIIGGLKHPEQHQGVSFNTLTKGYTEAGLVIDNILRINYLNFAYFGLGGGVYYRYGAYHLPGGIGENLAFRLSMALDF